MGSPCNKAIHTPSGLKDDSSDSIALIKRKTYLSTKTDVVLLVSNGCKRLSDRILLYLTVFLS